MHATPLIAAFLFNLASLASAQDIDSDDVPGQCASVCAPVVSLTQSCDRDLDGDDQLNCICTGMDAASSIPLCEACYATYDTNDGHDNDVHDLVTKCSFSTTTYDTATASTGTSTTSGVILITGTLTITTSSAPTTTTPAIAISGSDMASTADQQTPSPTTDAAAIHTPHWIAGAGGVLGGAFAVLL